MRNTHGAFIWYELLTTDPDAAARFYAAVVGWTDRPAGPGADYRIFGTGEADVGGLARQPDAAAALAGPAWLAYVGVDDADAATQAVVQAGGSRHVPPTDLPDVGRFAMVADPQGVVFYVMRGAVDAPSRAFAPDLAGHCRWNELATPDPAAALEFYGRCFGWEPGEAMPMEGLGDYRFVNLDGGMIGAVMPLPPGGTAGWTFYFGVPDFDAAAARLEAEGGRILDPPQQIPGGEYALAAADPQGARFGLIGPRS